MLQFIKYSILVLFLFLMYSCTSNPTSPELTILNEKDSFNKITITQTNYDSFNVRSSENFILNSKKISKIILGENINGTFNGSDTVDAIYEQIENNFRLKFSISQKFSASNISHNFEIKYVTTDGLFYFFDSSLVTYKYPYPSTEIYAYMKNIFDSPSNDVQAFDIVNRKLFYHPYGPEGLYEYNINSKNKRLLFDYPGGNYLTATEKYVFCDLHTEIDRYNIETGAVDLTIQVLPNSPYSITGMDVSQDNLYVSTDEGKLLIYDLNFQLKDTLPYNTTSFYLAIYNNIAYSHDFYNKQIHRYNLETQKFLEQIPVPARNTEAITIIEDMMFFTELTVGTIRYFKLSDINYLE